MSATDIFKPQEPMDSSSQPTAERAAALQRMIREMLHFSNEDRRALLDTLATFFGAGTVLSPPDMHTGQLTRPSPSRNAFQFSEEPDVPSPKAFMLSKSPKTDVERVACLAYYLAHFRATPHFKTKDITTLNIESADRRFSNAAVAVDNAYRAGYLVPSVKGSKQLSAKGEQFVEALPDREAARDVFGQRRLRRPARPGKKNNTKAERE